MFNSRCRIPCLLSFAVSGIGQRIHKIEAKNITANTVMYIVYKYIDRTTSKPISPTYQSSGVEAIHLVSRAQTNENLRRGIHSHISIALHVYAFGECYSIRRL